MCRTVELDSGFGSLAPMASGNQDLVAPDAALVARMVEGDERALGELYDRHGTMAYSLACAIVRNAADADEAVADAFLHVWQKAARYDPGRGAVVGWLVTITRSRAIDHLRARQRRERLRAQVAEAREGSRSPTALAERANDEHTSQLDARRIASRLLAELPEGQRQAIEMAYFAGMTHSEIAAELGEPLGTVKTRIRTAMQKLRDALAPLRLRVEPNE